MYGVNLPWHLQLVAIPFNQLMAVLSSQPKFAPGQLPYYPKPFDGNLLSQSQVRYHWFRALYEQKNRSLKLVALATDGCGRV